MHPLPPTRVKIAKMGNSPDDCEDDCRITYPLRLEGRYSARFALTDGASESAFARDWAQILASNFVQRTPDLSEEHSAGLEEWLPACQESWRRTVPWSRIPWHGEAKTRAGALSTLLGLRFHRPANDPNSLHWQAVGVGDSCLFLVREEELTLSFPLNNADQFNSTPPLLCSNPLNNINLRDSVQTAEGTCQPGDIFLMMTDALAEWFLRNHLYDQEPWRILLDLQRGQWGPWVQEQRQERAMRNDDTTAIISRIG